MSDENLRPVVPEGTHLAWSRTNSGRKRALLFDNETNALIGPAELEEVEDDYSYQSDDEYTRAKTDEEIQRDAEAAAYLIVGIAAAAAALAYLSVVVYKKSAPPIRRFWSERLVPGVKTVWSRIFRRPAMEQHTVEAQLALMPAKPHENLPAVVDAVIQDHRESMGSKEAQKRLLAMFMAAGIIAEQMRALENVRIEDADLRAVKAAMQKLTEGDVTDEINLMLEQNPALLDPESLPEFVRLFGPGEVTKDVYSPLTNDAAKKALRLPGYDDPDAAMVTA